MKQLVLFVLLFAPLSYSQEKTNELRKESEKISGKIDEIIEYQDEIDKNSYEFGKKLFYYREFLTNNSNAININSLVSKSNPFINILTNVSPTSTHNAIFFGHLKSDRQLQECLGAWFKIFGHALAAATPIGKLFGHEHISHSVLVRGSQFTNALLRSKGFLDALEETSSDTHIQMKIKKGITNLDASISTSVNFAFNLFVFSKILKVANLIRHIKGVKPIFDQLSGIFSKILSSKFRHTLGRVDVSAFLATIGYKTYQGITKHRSMIRKFNDNPSDLFMSGKSSEYDKSQFIRLKIFKFLEKTHELSSLNFEDKDYDLKTASLDKEISEIFDILKHENNFEQVHILRENLSNEMSYQSRKRDMKNLIQNAQHVPDDLSPFEQRLVINYHTLEAINFFLSVNKDLKAI